MRKDYLTQLSGWARWMLPRQEAEDVIADYRDIIGTPPRPMEELLRDLGKPRDAAKALAQPRQYRVWLAAFAVMAFCILALGFSPTAFGFLFWRLFFRIWVEARPYGLLMTVPAVMIALVWFRFRGWKEKSLPKAVPILLAVFLVWTGGILLYGWAYYRDANALAEMWGTMITSFDGPTREVYRFVYLSQSVMVYGSPLISLAGVYSLIKARTGDRRWTAVYMLAMTAIVTTLVLLNWMSRVDVFAHTGYTIEQMLLDCVTAAAIGLICTGVALC